MIKLRNYPYPFRAILSICSDLDETPNEEIYFETCKYLNTSQNTIIGTGVSLEVGNTIYFKMPSGQFSFESASSIGKSKIFKLIKSGHIDCLHSFGDLVDSRDEALKYWKLLKQNGCNIKVWIDHAQAPSNLDEVIMYGKGANRTSPIYHADELFADGEIEYVWKGRVTSVIAQNTKRTLKGIYSIQHPIASLTTVFKEFLKGVLGRFGNEKYHMHTLNKTLKDSTLPDGQVVCEFMRSNPSYAGVSKFEKGREIYKVLTDRMMDHLVYREGTCILYTHLGKIHSMSKPFNDKSLAAFNNLSKRYLGGEILVTTTRRQLDYLKARQVVNYKVEQRDGRVAIVINAGSTDIDKYSGFTWYVDDPENVDIYLNEALISDAVRNGKDHTGKKSIMIPFKQLKFPDI